MKRIIRWKLWAIAGLVVTGQCSVWAQSSSDWIALGPSPIESPNANNNNTFIGNTNPVSGAIDSIAAHPANPNIVYVGTVNGGIWKTTNATATVPQWVQQTDQQLSGSIGDVAFDPTDSSNQTLIAGFGRFSSLGFSGGARAGVIRTTDGGTTWVPLGAEMQGRNITKVAARGNVLLAASDGADSNFCGAGGGLGLFRSIDTGASWNLVTNGLFGSSVSALAEDPSNSQVFYAGIISFNPTNAPDIGCGTDRGIFRSDDNGGTWSNVSSPEMLAVIDDTNSHFEISVGNSGAVFVGIVSNGRLAGVFRSANGVDNWAVMELPGTIEQRVAPAAETFYGIHPGGQGAIHSSLVVDASDDRIVYVGGDRQPWGSDETTGFGPNSIGACAFNGRLFRGDIRLSGNDQWQPITNNFADADGIATTDCNNDNSTAPHADSRDMAFDAAGNLLQSDDGGIYRRLSPRSPRGIWVDVNGNLQSTEQHSGRFDRLSAAAVSGNQDNGSSEQRRFDSTVWSSISGGDGGDVAIDYLAIANNSVRYSSAQNFANATRRQFSQAGVFQGGAFLALNTLGAAEFTGQFVTPIDVNQVVGNRLIIGGDGAVFESLDRGDNILEVPPIGVVAAGFGRRSIAYGANGNVDLLFVAAADGQLYRRQVAGGNLQAVYSSGVILGLQAVLLDGSNSAQVFALEPAQVLRSTRAGDPGSFVSITADLINLFSPGPLRTMTLMKTPDGDVLAVGADRGVYFATAAAGYTDWIQAGTSLPNTPVFDLNYDFSANRLIAFTLGRGAFVLPLTGIIGPGTTVCSTPNRPIADASSTGLSDSLDVPTNGILTNLTATVQINHSFVGDLIVRLRNDATGTEIALLDRPGIPDLSADGCGFDNINAQFDDRAATAVDNVCVDAPVTISGTFRPEQALAAFAGETAAGRWTLNVSDNALQDEGVLVNWCLGSTVSGGGAAVIFKSSFEDP